MAVRKSPFWTDQELASASLEDLRKHGELVKQQADELSRQYAREMADKPSAFWGAYDAATRQIQESTRYGLARLVGLSSQEARDFRYNSLPLFRGYATFIRNWGQALKEYEGPGDMQMLARISARAGQMTALESNQGYPWAQKNPEKVESYALNTLDPLLLASFATDGLKGFAEARELKALTPFAKAMMEAPNAEAIVLAGKPLWGADPARPLFAQAVQEMTKAGASVEDVAKMLHEQGLRTSQWAAASSLPLSKYFKRGNNLASPGLMDRMEAAFGEIKKPTITGQLPRGALQADLNKLKLAMKAEYQAALEKLPGLTLAEKDLVDWAEKNIPRDQYDPLGSFRRGYAAAVQRGEAPAIDEQLYRKMEAYVSALSSGWREGTAWRSAYSTSLRDAQRINLGLDPIRGISEQELAQRPWRLSQQAQGTIQGAENFAKWHAHVASREINADRAEKLIEAVKARVQELSSQSRNHLLSTSEEIEAVRNGTKPIAWIPMDQARDSGLPYLELKHTMEDPLAERSSAVIYGTGYKERAAEFVKPKAFVPQTSTEVHAYNGRLLGYTDDAIREFIRGPIPESVPILPGSNEHELELTQQLQRDLRRIVDTPDHITYDQTQKVSKLLAAYDYTIASIKTAWLKFSPGFYVHRLVDMAGARALATTGETHLVDTLKAAFTKEPAPIRDIFGMPFHAGEGFEKSLGLLSNHSAIGAMDQEALNHMVRHHYNDLVKGYLESGMAPKTADRLAKRNAAKVAEMVHGIYSAESPATEVLDRTHYFWRHYWGRMEFWAKMAYDNPGEAYALTRLRELQQQHSVDGRGAFKLPFIKLAVDWIGRMTPIQVMEPLINPDYFARPYESAAYVPARAAYALLGNWTLPFQEAGEHAGVLPPQGDRPSDIESIVGMVSRAATGQAVLPSDPFMHLLGRNPEESRQQYDDRKAQMFFAAAERAGKPISPDEARAQAESATTQAQLASFATGQRVLPMPDGFEDVAQAATQYREMMMATRPEDRGAMRAVLMQTPTFRGLQHVLPMDPELRFTTLQNRFDLERSRTDAAEQQAPTQEQLDQADKQQRLQNIQDAIHSSAWGSILDKAFDLFSSPASAAEMESNPPRNKKPVTWTSDSNGRPVPVPASSSPADAMEAMRAYKNFQMDETLLKTKGVSVQAIHDIIAQAKQADGTNPLLSDIQNQAPLSAQAQGFLDAYNYAETGSGSIRGDLPMGTSRNVQAITEAFKNYVRGAGLGAGQLVNAPPARIQALAASGHFNAPGVPKEAWDPYAIRVAQEAAKGLVGYAESEYHRQQAQKFPQTDPMMRELEQVVSRSPYSSHAEIEKINGMIGDGHLAPSFWSDSFAKDPSLYLRTAIANHQKDLALVQDQLFPWGANRGVNQLRLGELLLEPHGAAYVNMLRSYGSPAVQQQLNALADKPVPLHNGATLDDLAPINPQQLDATFGEDLNIKVGMTQSLHAQLSNLLESDLPARPTTTPGLAGQTLPLGGGENVVGQAQAALDFASKPGDTGEVHEQVEPKPIATQHPSLVQSPADIAHQISQNFFSSAESTPAISFTPPRLAPPAQPAFYNTLPEFFSAYQKNRETDIAQARQVEQEMGMPTGSLTPSGFSTFATTIQNDNGSYTMNPVPAASAALHLASLGENLAGVAPDSGLAIATQSGLQGISAGLEAGELATFMGAGAYAGPIGIGVGLAAGIASGFFNKPHQNNQYAEENLKINKERLALSQQEFAESQRKTQISDLRSNERDLLGTVRSSPMEARARIADQLTTNPYVFHPTFASRIGLVDQIERGLGNSLTPRY